jgi:hypothetical protein
MLLLADAKMSLLADSMDLSNTAADRRKETVTLCDRSCWVILSKDLVGASEAQSSLGTGFNTPSALYAVGLLQDLIDWKLHGADLLAFLALYAQIPIYLELVLIAPKSPL